MNDVLIIIPTYNEIENIDKIKSILKLMIRFRLMVYSWCGKKKANSAFRSYVYQ